jgi:hypothetical protein
MAKEEDNDADYNDIINKGKDDDNNKGNGNDRLCWWWWHWRMTGEPRLSPTTYPTTHSTYVLYFLVLYP